MNITCSLHMFPIQICCALQLFIRLRVILGRRNISLPAQKYLCMLLREVGGGSRSGIAQDRHP